MRFINRKTPAGKGDIDATLWQRKTRETVKGPGGRGRGDRAGRRGIWGSGPVWETPSWRTCGIPHVPKHIACHPECAPG